MYSAPSIVRVIKSRKTRWAEAGSRYGREEICKQGLVGIPERKKPFGRPRHRWEYNIEMNLQEVECGVWTGSI